MAPEAKVWLFWNFEMMHMTMTTTEAMEKGSGNIDGGLLTVGVTGILTATHAVPFDVKFVGQLATQSPICSKKGELHTRQ